MPAADTSEPESNSLLSSCASHVAIMAEAVAEVVVYYNYLTPSLAAGFTLKGQFIFFPILCVASIYRAVKAFQQWKDDEENLILNTINLIVSILTAICINVSLIGLLYIGIPFWFISGVLFTAPLIPAMIHATIRIITSSVELFQQTSDSEEKSNCHQAIAKAFFDLIITTIKTVFLFGCSIAHYGTFMPFSPAIIITTGLASMVLMSLQYAWEMPLAQSLIKSSFFKPSDERKKLPSRSSTTPFIHQPPPDSRALKRFAA